MENVKLIDLKASHLEMVRSWRNSIEVSQYMYNDHIISEEAQQIWFDKISKDETCQYWIITYEDKPLGVASLTGINPVLSSCYWAFYLGDTSVRGAGIGNKVEFQILSYVFDELKLNKLRCEVFSDNEKVVKMHEKFGFRREGYYREHAYKNNQYKDVVALAILKSEWLQIKSILKEKVYGK